MQTSSDPYRSSGDARSRTIGLWSALVFVLFLVALDVTETTNIIMHNSFGLLNVFISFFIPPSFVAMLAALHLSVPPSKRIWSLLGLGLTAVIAALGARTPQNSRIESRLSHPRRTKFV